MAKVIPYMTFTNSLKAIEYYKNIFGKDIVIERKSLTEEYAKNFGTEADENKTLHGAFNIHGSLIFFADNMQGKPISPMTILINFDHDDQKEVDKAVEIMKKAEKEGAVVVMPWAVQPWGGAFGIFVDMYGNQWMIHSESFKEAKSQNETYKNFYK